MSSKVVEDTIQAHLEANWNARSPVLTENEQGETPGDGSPFIVLQFPVANFRRVSITSRLYEEKGGFRIVINLERGSGTALMRQWGEDLAAMFRNQLIGTVDCLVPTEPFTDDQSDEGNYFTGAMTCEYQRFFYG